MLRSRSQRWLPLNSRRMLHLQVSCLARNRTCSSKPHSLAAMPSVSQKLGTEYEDRCAPWATAIAVLLLPRESACLLCPSLTQSWKPVAFSKRFPHSSLSGLFCSVSSGLEDRHYFHSPPHVSQLLPRLILTCTLLPPRCCFQISVEMETQGLIPTVKNGRPSYSPDMQEQAEP